MFRVCAWCGKGMGEKAPLEDKSVTHTICKECTKKIEVQSIKELSLRVTEKMVRKAIEGRGYVATPQKVKEIFDAIEESRHFDADNLLTDVIEYVESEKDWK